jgi:tetratricopeptide (TPR) repeat protein
MENYSEYIDDYFNKKLTTEEIKQFEEKIITDQEFAEQVAFYVSAKQMLKEEVIKEKKEWFRQLAGGNKAVMYEFRKAPVKKMWVYRLATAAAVLIIVFMGWSLFFNKSVDTQKLADKYIEQNFKTLPIKMSANEDSLQRGLKLYNDGQLDTSLKIFESILQKDSTNIPAKKDAGIVYLRLGNYNKALLYFQQLEKSSLYANPAALYYALTIMKRNQLGDKEHARQLLQKVVDNDLDGKETAHEWLNKKW